MKICLLTGVISTIAAAFFFFSDIVSGKGTMLPAQQQKVAMSKTGMSVAASVPAVKSKSAKSKSFPTLTQKSLLGKLSYEVLGPSNEYDVNFMRVWWRMMRQLWTADGKENGIKEAMPVSVVNFVPRKDEKPYRIDKLVAHWTSPDCKFVDLDLKHVRTIQPSEKNEVLLMEEKTTHKRYVLKTISNPDSFFSELSFFYFLDREHPYFARAVCHRRTKDDEGDYKARIIFEYVGGMESLTYSRSCKLDDLKRITAQLFLALEHIHYLKFIHADIKPHNVLIDVEGNVKVIDLGFSAQLPYGKKSQGTHFTMAPELHSMVPGEVHEGIDWWAFGSTVAMWYGSYYDEIKYRASHKGEASGRTGHKHACIPLNWNEDHFESGPIFEAFPADLRSFLFMFFSADPEARVFNTPRLLKQIRGHEFFKGFNWSELHGGDFGELYKMH